MTKEEYLSQIADNKIKEKETVLKILKCFVDTECKDVIEYHLRTSTKGHVSFEYSHKVSTVMKCYDDASEILVGMLKEKYPFLDFCVQSSKVDDKMVGIPTGVFFDLSKEV